MKIIADLDSVYWIISVLQVEILNKIGFHSNAQVSNDDK